jgi:hypothetical protein
MASYRALITKFQKCSKARMVLTTKEIGTLGKVKVVFGRGLNSISFRHNDAKRMYRGFKDVQNSNKIYLKHPQYVETACPF